MSQDPTHQELQSEKEAEDPAPTRALFSIGDKVKFVKITIRGNSREFKTMEGTIEEFSKPIGIKALVKYHGGNKIWRKLDDLRRLDQPSPLNAIMGMNKKNLPYPSPLTIDL